MKCLSMMRLAGVIVAAAVCGSPPADAAEVANPNGLLGDGYGGAGYAPGMPGYGGGAYAPGMGAYGAPAGYVPGMASYAGYGYGSYGDGGYGYGGYGYGGRGHAGYGPRGRRHHCSFGGNSAACCAGVWDGYCNGGNTGCGCGAPVKVHRRHRALGCGAGPCVDAAACGSAGPAPRRHRCHLRRWLNGGWGPMDAGCGCEGAAGMMMGPTSAQPNVGDMNNNMSEPNSSPEPVEAPMPGIDADEPPAPEEESST